jgi:hypothetical protein
VSTRSFSDFDGLCSMKNSSESPGRLLTNSTPMVLLARVRRTLVEHGALLGATEAQSGPTRF